MAKTRLEASLATDPRLMRRAVEAGGAAAWRAQQKEALARLKALQAGPPPKSPSKSKSLNSRFKPTVRLDASQIRDRRPVAPPKPQPGPRPSRPPG